MTELNLGHNNLVGTFPEGFTGLTDLETFIVDHNNFNRTSLHDAVIPSGLLSWYVFIDTKDISNQGDITPPVLTSTGTILSPVSTQFSYSFSVNENSYAIAHTLSAVASSGQGMPLSFTGPSNCTYLTSEITHITGATGLVTITISPIAA